MPDLVHCLQISVLLLQIPNSGDHLQQQVIQFLLLIQIGSNGSKLLLLSLKRVIL